MARTKEFDEDAVLLKAMRLFWERGYEKTSVSDLVEHMGIHKKSIYDTFGDKQSLYVKALKRYGKMMSERLQRYDNLTSITAIQTMFQRVVQREDEAFPKGCLLVNTMVELGLHDAECKDWINQWSAGYRKKLRVWIEKGQQAREIDPRLNAEELAYYLFNALVGLRVLVKTTDDQTILQTIIETTMSVLKK